MKIKLPKWFWNRDGIRAIRLSDFLVLFTGIVILSIFMALVSRAGFERLADQSLGFVIVLLLIVGKRIKTRIKANEMKPL